MTAAKRRSAIDAEPGYDTDPGTALSTRGRMIQVAHHGDTPPLTWAYACVVDARDLRLLTKPICPDVRVAGPSIETKSTTAFFATLKTLGRYQGTGHLVANHTTGWVGDEFRGDTQRCNLVAR